MIKVKNTEAKVSARKRNITVSGVSVVNGVLVDEDGPIAGGISNELPDGVDKFTIKISIELPEEEDVYGEDDDIYVD